MTDATLDDLLRVFFAEAEENLATMEQGLLALERMPADEETINTVFRVTHSLKGGAACVGFELVSDFAHVAEDLLDRIRDGSLRATTEIITALLLSVDTLRDLIRASAAGRTTLTADEESLADLIRRIAQHDSGAVEALKSATRRPAARGNALTRTVRVETERIDRMVDLSGEMAIALGRMRHVAETLPRATAEPLIETWHECERLFLDLQELVMKARMVPIGTLFAPFHRTVRDLAREREKTARLTVAGDDVEIDHDVADRLRDPITQLVRNAVDHGIESPDARAASGKEPCGQITMSAVRESGMIVIRIRDDGAGISRERVIAQATRHGVLQDSPILSDAETLALLFRPGFSTAHEINDVSGRGVGLDVVRRNVEALHGSVSIESIEGSGATFTIRLPLTLAIIDGFGVSVGDEQFVIPLPLVTECLQFPADARRDEAGGILDLRGEPLPFVRLGRLLGVAAPPSARENVVIVQCGDRRAGIAVDHLVGESPVVVKPMSELFRAVPGISGSAILGSGQVALILDVPVLLEELKEIA